MYFSRHYLYFFVFDLLTDFDNGGQVGIRSKIETYFVVLTGFGNKNFFLDIVKGNPKFFNLGTANYYTVVKTSEENQVD